MSLLVIRSLCLGLALFPWAGIARAQAVPAAQPFQAASPDSAEFSRLRDQAQQESDAGKTANAIRDTQEALALQPEWKEGWWNLGMLQYTSGRYPDAAGTFAKVTAFAPNLGVAWGIRGLSEYETGRYDDALEHLERADTLGMADDEEIARVSQYHLGLLLIRDGEFDRASSLLAAKFGTGTISAQAKIALGLATLRVPLLPSQIDPSREALLADTGAAAVATNPDNFAAVVRDHPDLPYLHLAWCRALARAAKYHEALEQCRAESRLSPASPLPWMETSHIELLLGARAAALRSAQNAVRLDPSSAAANKSLAEAAGSGEGASEKHGLAAMLPVSEASPDPRMTRLFADSGATSAEADDAAQARWKQALHEYVAGNYGAASIDLKAWLVATPSSGTGWALLGLCEFALKDYDSALLHLDRSAKLGLSASSGSIDQARYTYGVLLVHAGRFDEAQSVLATAWHPSGPLTQQVELALGLALLRRPEFPSAIGDADRSLVGAAGKIAVLLEQSHYDQAFPQFKTLLTQYPNVPFLHYAYGTALMALSEFDQAAAQMQAERTRSPQSELPCLRLASISLRESDPGPAVRWAQCALALAPNSVDAHYLLGRAALGAGDVTNAIHELEIASSLSPESPEIHFNLARAYARARMADKAERERETFSRLNDAQKTAQP